MPIITNKNILNKLIALEFVVVHLILLSVSSTYQQLFSVAKTAILLEILYCATSNSICQKRWQQHFLKCLFHFSNVAKNYGSVDLASSGIMICF